MFSNEVTISSLTQKKGCFFASWCTLFGIIRIPVRNEIQAGRVGML